MLLQQYSNKFKENQTTTSTMSSTSTSTSTSTSNAKSNIELAVLAEEAIKALMQHTQHISSTDTTDTQEFFESQAKLNEFVKELEEEAKKCRDQN